MKKKNLLLTFAASALLVGAGAAIAKGPVANAAEALAVKAEAVDIERIDLFKSASTGAYITDDHFGLVYVKYTPESGSLDWTLCGGYPGESHLTVTYWQLNLAYSDDPEYTYLWSNSDMKAWFKYEDNITTKIKVECYGRTHVYTRYEDSTTTTNAVAMAKLKGKFRHKIDSNTYVVSGDGTKLNYSIYNGTRHDVDKDITEFNNIVDIDESTLFLTYKFGFSDDYHFLVQFEGDEINTFYVNGTLYESFVEYEDVLALLDEMPYVNLDNGDLLYKDDDIIDSNAGTQYVRKNYVQEVKMIEGDYQYEMVMNPNVLDEGDSGSFFFKVGDDGVISDIKFVETIDEEEFIHNYTLLDESMIVGTGDDFLEVAKGKYSGSYMGMNAKVTITGFSMNVDIEGGASVDFEDFGYIYELNQTNTFCVVAMVYGQIYTFPFTLDENGKVANLAFLGQEFTPYIEWKVSEFKIIYDEDSPLYGHLIVVYVDEDNPANTKEEDLGKVVGKDGETPTIEIKNGTWWINGVDTGVKATGEKGEPGQPGTPGEPGQPGEKGEPGKDGQTPYIGENGNWWIGTTDTGVKATAEAAASNNGVPTGLAIAALVVALGALGYAIVPKFLKKK